MGVMCMTAGVTKLSSVYIYKFSDFKISPETKTTFCSKKKKMTLRLLSSSSSSYLATTAASFTPHLLFSTSSIGSPARVQKLIASQTDPLIAKEIFDLAAHQPNFRHSYSSYHTLILKLGRARHFTLMQSILTRLKHDAVSVTPGLFSDIVRLYADANLPDKVFKTFYTMLEFNCKPLPKHMNHFLEILVAHRNYLRPAFDIFRAAGRFEIDLNARSYNIMMRAFCLNDDLSIAYKLFNEMFKRDVLPDVESYRILMQGLCRKSQVSKAVDLLEDMSNKGFVPDTLSYTTLLNSLCRKKKLREAYKLLCRMKVKGCNPDIMHYNTVILGFCREGRALDACKVMEDMPLNGCLPNLVSYRTLVGGLCGQGLFDDAKRYMDNMILKGFSPHFSGFHVLIKGLCNVGKVEEGCAVLLAMLQLGEAPHTDSWLLVLPRICGVYEDPNMLQLLESLQKIEINKNTRIIEAGAGLEDYLINKINSRQWRKP